MQEDTAEFDETRLSKLLAFLLRHKPDHVGMTLDPDGAWVDVDLLVERINQKGGLPFPIDRTQVEEVVGGPSRGLFEQQGDRVRARSGHSVSGLTVDSSAPPEFLFGVLAPDEVEARQRDGCLVEDAEGQPLQLVEDEQGIREEQLVVVEAARAARSGVEFERDAEAGTYQARSIPVRFVVTMRAGYERQVSAGGVLARGTGEEAEFALIRTLPRSQTAPKPEEQAKPTPEPEAEVEPADVEDPRADSDRRAGDRRREDRANPPQGVERRRGRSRRMRRRRRSGRWGPSGRLELPKGKLEPGETPEQAAVREVREEMGIREDLEVVVPLSRNHYTFRTPDGKCIFKTVYYFLLLCDESQPVFQPRREEGIVSVEWWNAQRAIQQVAFPNLKPVLERAWQQVAS